MTEKKPAFLVSIIVVKFGIGVLYKLLSTRRDFHETPVSNIAAYIQFAVFYSFLSDLENFSVGDVHKYLFELFLI